MDGGVFSSLVVRCLGGDLRGPRKTKVGTNNAARRGTEIRMPSVFSPRRWEVCERRGREERRGEEFLEERNWRLLWSRSVPCVIRPSPTPPRTSDLAAVSLIVHRPTGTGTNGSNSPTPELGVASSADRVSEMKIARLSRTPESHSLFQAGVSNAKRAYGNALRVHFLFRYKKKKKKKSSTLIYN